ncbi:MAG: bis-aminopropyl spermidine synthase family protein [Candidatus Bathyarchaeota archaeon]|nr:MAG: bis-aminopropyl spermidine synthase family protein [Candidatus Bathyarchaeota archaeon]
MDRRGAAEGSPDRNDGGPQEVLKTVAAEMALREGEEAVRRILTEIHRRGKVKTKDLAKAARLPTPVAAAIRRELEKRGLVARRGGAVLTEEGERLVEGLGLADGEIKHPKTRLEISFTEEHDELLNRLREVSARRPTPDTKLDQAYATPETALRRALYMLGEGDLAGRDVLFLGDDDLTSVAAGLLSVVGSITVMDIDERLLELIGDTSRSDKLGIDCVSHDLRRPLPEEHQGRYDVVFTDPSYTIPGLVLFLSRAVQALRSRKTASVYVAFVDKPPLEMLEVHREITGMGLFVRELIPGFNEYEGAEMFANTSSLMRLSTTEETRPAVTGAFEGGIYTGELTPSLRVYRCRCEEGIKVGAGEQFSTIEELKSSGCPRCGRREGFRLVKKTRLSSADRDG